MKIKQIMNSIKLNHSLIKLIINNFIKLIKWILKYYNQIIIKYNYKYKNVYKKYNKYNKLIQ